MRFQGLKIEIFQNLGIESLNEKNLKDFNQSNKSFDTKNLNGKN